MAYYALKIKDGSGNIQTVGDPRTQDKADLASPSLTGTPTAPTATAGTNTTQIATTAFVSTAVSNLIDGAPGALDTLNELAAALGDDANYASTITNALALKADLASPSFTGTPTAPTAAADTNTTQVATTAFVVGQGYLKSSSASSTYAPLASPALTGTPTATTATAGDNSTRIATTAYVDAAAAAASPADGSITSAKIANGTIVDEDISASAAIAQSKVSGLTTALDAKPDLFIASSTPGTLGNGDFWLDTSAAV